MGRGILAVLAGTLVAVILIAIVEYIGHLVYPLPQGVDPTNVEALKAAMAAAPIGALLFVLLAWGVGTFVGAWVGARIARHAHVLHAIIVGVLTMTLGIVNMLTIPHPLWFWILGILVFLPSAYGGGRLARTSSPA